MPSPRRSELLIQLEIVPAAKSNTRNFVTANGSSRDTIGLKDSHNGLISSTCSPGSNDTVFDEVDVVGALFDRFCSYDINE
jgi:hypothetical protein